MKQVTEKDLHKLSDVSGVSMPDLQHLHAMGLFKPHAVFNCLIKHDYKRIRAERRYTVGQVISALMNEYQVSWSTVENAIYEKRVKEKFCPKCGRIVRKTELARNQGVCDACAIRAIEL